jgi:hypothetical protein
MAGRIQYQRPTSTRSCCRVMVVMLMLTGMAGCAGRTLTAGNDSVEALLPASQELTRSAVIKVLSEAGYTVDAAEDARVLKTEYREEIRGPWDRLVVYRFGTIRSWVEVSMVAETDATRIRIDVYCEGKDSLFASWHPYETPLRQQATTHLREVRKTLDLL